MSNSNSEKVRIKFILFLASKMMKNTTTKNSGVIVNGGTVGMAIGTQINNRDAYNYASFTGEHGNVNIEKKENNRGESDDDKTSFDSKKSNGK
jgi:hypothetical protein